MRNIARASTAGRSVRWLFSVSLSKYRTEAATIS